MVYDSENIKNNMDKLFKDDNLTKRQREALKKFNERCRADGLAVASRRTYIEQIRNFGRRIKKDFEKISKDEIVKYFGDRSDEVSKTTVNQEKISIRKFYKFLSNKKDGYPEKVDWIKTGINNNNKLKKEDLISREELEKMVATADTIRDKAILYLLYETGARKSEFVNLDLKDVKFDEYGCKISIRKSKTFSRNVRVLGSAVIVLREWINNHKDKNKDDAPLFYSFSTNSYGERLGLNGLVEKIAKRAGIEKNVYPHLFRHSRATEIAKKEYNESFMRAFFGWNKSSNMPSVYIHLKEDTDDRMLKHEGVIDENGEKKEKKLSEPVVCPNCNTKNLPSNLYCKNCTTKLGEEVSKQTREALQDLVKLMLKDGEIRNTVQKKSEEKQWKKTVEKLSKSLQ